IRAESIAIVQSDASNTDHRIYIFAIHVKDGDRLASSQLRRKSRRMRFAGYGGEADQIVGDDVYRSAHGVAGQIGKVQRFGNDTLSGKSGITVYQQRKIFLC